jgi:2'-5' RNA ligase
MRDEKKRGMMNDERGSKDQKLSSSSFIVPPSSFDLQPSALSPQPLARVFCAVELPTQVRERAARHITRLRDAVPYARASWERMEKLHITLKFLGEIESNQVEALSDAASRAAQLARPFMLALEDAGAFPPRGVPRILWLGIKDLSGALIVLHKHLEEECERAGFAREERSFHPHVTIARIRTPRAARQLARLHHESGFEAIEFSVTELVVMRSELAAGGSRYTEISRHRFELEVSE